MVVAAGRIALWIPGANSLKEKRRVLRSVLDSARARFNVAVAEVGDQDLWQRAAIGFAVVSNERSHAEGVAESLIHHVDRARDCEITDRRVEVISLGDTIHDLAPGSEERP